MRQEFDEHGNHRLVDEDGSATTWAHYKGFTYHKGKVGVTDYWTGSGERIMDPVEFCMLAGAKEIS